MISSGPNLFILINDGFRWQEVFRGADESLINDPKFTADPGSLRSMFWDDQKEERRKKLLPFLWNIVWKEGILIGDRDMNSKVNAANLYSISYSGYNEIFTGTTDIFIANNNKRYNKNISVLEYLNNKPSFKDKIVIFSSWDSFPYILNEKRSGLIINNGFERTGDNGGKVKVFYNGEMHQSEDTNYDMLMFIHAVNYIKQYHPRIVVIVFGETDVVAHKKKYDLYLYKAHHVDMMMAELWNFVQTSESYKNNTTFLLTTDHGRGNKYKSWHDHGFLVRGSSQTWLGVVGPGSTQVRKKLMRPQLYNKQFANLIANIVGEGFSKAHSKLNPANI